MRASLCATVTPSGRAEQIFCVPRILAIWPELLRRQPHNQHARQFLRIQARQMAAQVGAKPFTEVRRAEHGDDRLGPGRGVLHHVLQ